MMRKKPLRRSAIPSPSELYLVNENDPSDAVAELAIEGPVPYLVRRLQQVVSAIFAEEMEVFDVTIPQYAALSVVVEIPNLDQNTTAFLAGVERTTIVGVINRLVNKGLLKRTRSKSDKRVRLLQPTEAGVQFMRQVREPIQRISSRLLDPLPAKQRTAFCKTIKALLRDRLRTEADQLYADRRAHRRNSARQLAPAAQTRRSRG
jgi:DNA-binding MarR family transcriptional regulator